MLLQLANTELKGLSINSRSISKNPGQLTKIKNLLIIFNALKRNNSAKKFYCKQTEAPIQQNTTE